jgi:oligopeptide transport system ATP-binding protein
MYAGHVVESCTSEELFANPRMPYTMGLLKSIPRLDESKKEKLHPIKGSPPDLLDLPKGCPFISRCEYSMDVCKTELPLLRSVSTENRLGIYAPNVAGTGVNSNIKVAEGEDYEQHLIACHAEVKLGDPPKVAETATS